VLLANLGGSWIAVVLIGTGFIVMSVRRGRRTTCPHCDHDSGTPIARERICPACGQRRDRGRRPPAAKPGADDADSGS
jgi:hypothetical protein